MKNCGQTVHDEVANKQTMEELKELLKVGSWKGQTVLDCGECSGPEAGLFWVFAGTWGRAVPGGAEDRKVSTSASGIPAG